MTMSLNPFAKSPTVRIRWIPEIAGELLPRFQQLERDVDVSLRPRVTAPTTREMLLAGAVRLHDPWRVQPWTPWPF